MSMLRFLHEVFTLVAFLGTLYAWSLIGGVLL